MPYSFFKAFFFSLSFFFFFRKILQRNATYDATHDVGLQSYTVTKGDADVAQSYRYEDTAACGDNLNAHPNNSSAHRGNRRGDHKANP